MQANLDAVQVKVSLPDYLMGAVEQGEEAGQISVILGDYVLQTIPLIADREVKKSNWFICLADKIVFIFYNT